MADEGINDLRNSPMTDMSEDGSCEDAAQVAVHNFIKKYFKVVKECGEEGGCFADKYVTLKGEEANINKYGSNSHFHDFVTADGMIIEITYADIDTPFQIYVDINGKKGPNKIGYDLWSMTIFYDGSIDENGVSPECKKDKLCYIHFHSTNYEEVRQNRFYGCLNDGNHGYGGCFGHFLENNFKFDY